MLYDLNIVWTPSTTTDELHHTLRFAKSLGYDVVALNHTVAAPIPKIVINEIPLLADPAALPAPITNVQPSPALTRVPLPTVLRRVTVTVADPGATNHKLSEFARAYDVLAVRPATAQAFQWACLSADDASLISLDMAAPLGYHIAPRTAMAAVQRGARFEICYGQAIQARGAGEGPQRARSHFIANTLALLRATKGRGLVASSEARSALALRGPADVINLLAVWGLGPDKGTEALRAVPRSVVVNEAIRRRGFRGVVDILETAGPDPNPPERREKDAQGKGNKKNAAAHGQKRKNNEGTESGPPEEGAQATLSKRQAKKLRLEAEKTSKQNKDKDKEKVVVST